MGPSLFAPTDEHSPPGCFSESEPTICASLSTSYRSPGGRALEPTRKRRFMIQSVAAKIPMLDLARQFAGIRNEVLSSLENILDSQALILGPAVEHFETSAAQMCGVPHAVGCASGTDALWLALAAARIGPGDAVLTTPFSFFATVSSILRAGATPFLADIDPKTYNLAPVMVEEAIESIRHSHPDLRLRAVMPVHLYGQCADMDALQSISHRHNLLLIEDAAQAFGAAWQGQPAGALGHAAAFSFYPTKNLSAAGDAGLVTTKDPELAERSRMLRSHGMRRRYEHDEVGANSRMDSLQAAILQVKLRYLPHWNEQRREIAARYDDQLRATGLAAPMGSTSVADGLVLPFADPRATHVFHQYVLRAPRRNELREYLTLHGVASEVYYPIPLHQQQALATLDMAATPLVESERAAEEVLALPIFPELRQDEQAQVVATIADFYSC